LGGDVSAFGENETVSTQFREKHARSDDPIPKINQNGPKFSPNSIVAFGIKTLFNLLLACFP
jgi:hypothetical protein